MAKLVCVCLCLFVQLVVGQFGFFPPRENRGYSQSLLNPFKIRQKLEGLLHLQPQNPNTNPAFVYPFNNRPTDQYGRPVYEYGRPNYENERPNYENGRPTITNNNMMPNQNQFGVPNGNHFQEQYGANQNSFQNPPRQNDFQNIPVGFPTAPLQNDFGFQNSQSQNGFQEPPSQNGFQPVQSQVQFPNTPTQNQYSNTNGNGVQNSESQNGFQNPPSQSGFPQAPSPVGFPDTPPQNEFGNANEFQNLPSENGFQNPPSQIGFQNPPSKNEFQDASSQVGFTTTPSSNSNGNGFQEYIAPNSDANSNEPKEAKQNEDTLIVIPAGTTDTNEDGLVFGGPTNAVLFPVSKDEAKEVSKDIDDNPKATEPTTLPPLKPLAFDSRNNFNFGPSGIFQETCTTVDNEIGSCLQVTECQPYLKLIQESRSNPNALRLLRQAHCGFQGSNPKVCCPRPGIPTGPPPTPTTSTTEAAIVMPIDPVSEEPIKEEPREQLTPISLPEAPVCGVSNASFSRVVGGIPAKLGDFPWMALLGYKERRAGAGARWLCGGSLISARHVLTAAHCIHTRENDLYLVRLGELDLAREDEGATPVDVLIRTLVKHEEYSPKSFTNDIGILVLQRNVQFTNLIQPICIPRTSELRTRSYENYNPLIAGWGDTEFRGPSATHLQVLQLPVVSNDFCAQAYAAYKAQVIDQRVLCAGFKNGGKDACQGDSGGPLMQPVYNKETRTTFFYQIGVVSYGRRCAEAGFPGVYTRVTNFVPWIEDTVAKN